MKRNILIPTMMILLATIFVAVIPTEAEAKIYEDTIRLHILALSDSEEDQSIKLALRDAILKEYGNGLSGFSDINDATSEIKKKLPEIEDFANRELSKMGCSAKSTVTLSTEWYDTREYEGFALPSGYYTSLRIVIGEGKGQNWWCVMFPPLCLDAAVEKNGYTKAENKLIRGKYTVKFKLLSLLSELGK